MNPSVFSIFEYWPAIAAGAIGAAVPRGKDWRVRAAFGVISALMFTFVLKAWAPPADQAKGLAAEWPHLLNALIFLPAIGAAAVLFLPRQAPRLLKGFTIAVLAVGFVISLSMLSVPTHGDWHFQYIHEWLPALGIRYHVAVDGISLWLVILTTFCTPIAALVAFNSIKTRIKDLCFALLLMQTAMIASFCALDLFLFYCAFELMLVPMYIMIGIWGGAEKIKASIKFFLFTMFGSVLMLAAILYLVWSYTRITGAPSFDLLALSQVMHPQTTQTILFWAFALAFFIKVPMFPVHTWLPDAHVQAPTAGSFILAAIMLKVGTYGYMRFAMGLFPFTALHACANLAGVAALGGITYGALCAWKQTDIKKLVAYSSVAHLGYVMLGLFGATEAGMKGAVLQMINHGISTGALFFLVGAIYDRRHTRMVEEYGGIAKKMPVFAACWLVVTFASIGVPGTNGFVGEFMIIMGTYSSAFLGKFSGMDAGLAAFGVILAAVYMLSVTRKVFFGKITNPKNEKLKDLTVTERLIVLPLILMIFIIGLFPNLILTRMDGAISGLATRMRERREVSKQHGNRPAALIPLEDPAFMRGAPPVGKKAKLAIKGAK